MNKHLLDKFEELRRTALERGAGAAEVFDGDRLVWLETTRTADGRVVWSLDERRIARAAALSLLDEAWRKVAR